MASVVCHCQQCQRQSGAAFSVNVVLMESQLTVVGELSTFEERGEDGDKVYVYRRFCGSCGSPIYSALMEPEGVIALKAGTLDDHSFVAPVSQIWTDHKQAWVDVADIPAKARE